MKILFVTTDENNHLDARDRAQGDYHENVALIGLRNLLGQDCVDYPRKRILYHDFSDVPRNSLHGKGFSLYHEPIQDIPNSCRSLDNQRFDVLLYGTAFCASMVDIPELEAKCRFKFYIDGHDLYGIAPKGKYIYQNGEKLIGSQVSPAFKTQLMTDEKHLYPFGVAVPTSRILPINLPNKKKLFKSTYPKYAFFENPNEYSRKHYTFDDEELYYIDMAESWFGLSCKKGGWDSMRNYEIIAAGSMVIYRDYYLKPKYCSPGDLPAYSYSTKEGLMELMNRLVSNNTPTQEYISLLNMQRQWLRETATTEARAKYIIKVLETYDSQKD